MDINLLFQLIPNFRFILLKINIDLILCLSYFAGMHLLCGDAFNMCGTPFRNRHHVHYMAKCFCTWSVMSEVRLSLQNDHDLEKPF